MQKLNRKLLTANINNSMSRIAGPIATLTTCIVFAIFLLPYFAHGMSDNEATPAKKYSLGEIAEIASKYNVSIIDWQHDEYEFVFDKEKINKRNKLVKWLKNNLRNWSLLESAKVAAFYLLPVGIEGEIFLNEKIEFEAVDYKEIIEKAKIDYKKAIPISISNINHIPEIGYLSDIAESEKEKRLFYLRTVKEKDSQGEYTFSLAYHKDKDKFLPYERNGSPVSENKLEGFLCYDTISKYIKKRIAKLHAKRLDNWIYLYEKNNKESFIGISSGKTGLEVVAYMGVEGKTILTYYIKSREGGFNCATLIPTSPAEHLQVDNVNYFERNVP